MPCTVSRRSPGQGGRLWSWRRPGAHLELASRLGDPGSPAVPRGHVNSDKPGHVGASAPSPLRSISKSLLAVTPWSHGPFPEETPQLSSRLRSSYEKGINTD